jgi:ecotin
MKILCLFLSMDAGLVSDNRLIYPLKIAKTQNMEFMNSGKVSRIASLRLSGILFLFWLLASTGSCLMPEDVSSNAAKELKAFPPAGEGMSRFVIMLPPRKEEGLLKVQLLVGKTVKLDPQNRYFFGGKLETETISGWGYDRYVLKSLGPMAGTLMAVYPDVPKVERFITLGGEPQLLRYNSRLPLVVYVPEGVEVRYRIWRADQEIRLSERK